MEDQWEPGALLQKEGGAQPVFALDDSDLGCRDLAKHNIDIHRRASIQASSKYLFKEVSEFPDVWEQIRMSSTNTRQAFPSYLHKHTLHPLVEGHWSITQAK